MAAVEDVRSSARGWQGIQLAALGFIGLCGVLWDGDGNPGWVQGVAGVLVLGALVLSCVAVAVVGTVAWPIPGSDDTDAGALAGGARRLRVGIALTFVAVAALAAGATTGWWPSQKAPSAAVQLTTRAGGLCGDLVQAEPGSVAVEVAGRTVIVPLGQVVSLRSVRSCD